MLKLKKATNFFKSPLTYRRNTSEDVFQHNITKQKVKQWVILRDVNNSVTKVHPHDWKEPFMNFATRIHLFLLGWLHFPFKPCPPTHTFYTNYRLCGCPNTRFFIYVITPFFILTNRLLFKWKVKEDKVIISNNRRMKRGCGCGTTPTPSKKDKSRFQSKIHVNKCC